MQCTVAEFKALQQQVAALGKAAGGRASGNGGGKAGGKKAKARAKGLGMEQRAAGAREEVGRPNPVIVAELPTITLRNAGA